MDACLSEADICPGAGVTMYGKIVAGFRGVVCSTGCFCSGVVGCKGGLGSCAVHPKRITNDIIVIRKYLALILPDIINSELCELYIILFVKTSDSGCEDAVEIHKNYGR